MAGINQAIRPSRSRHLLRTLSIVIVSIFAVSLVAVLAPIVPAGPVNLTHGTSGSVIDVGQVRESLTYAGFHCGMVYYQFTGSYQYLSTYHWYCG